MLRLAVMVGALAAFFSAAVFLGGDAVGAWDEPRIAPDRPDGAQKPKAKDAARGRRDERSDGETRTDAARARFVAEVDALCVRAAREAAAIATPASPAQAERYLRRVERLNARLNDRFAALEPPRSLAADARRVVTLLRHDERLLRELVAAVAAGDAPAATAAAAALQRGAALESALLVALGAKRCDAGLSPSSHGAA